MPLAKSYSANVGYPKRDSWQRSHSTPVGGGVEPKGQAAISSATRRKLEKLRFRPKDGDDASKDGRNANEGNAHNPTDVTDPTDGAGPEQPAAPNSGRPRAPHKTPVSKHSWEDYHGVDGEAAVDEDDQVSPSDRIMWVPTGGPDTYYARMSDLVRPKRGKKRARSSSPTSSPLDTRATAQQSPVVNIQKLSQAFRTPHADPTLELWDRFTTSGGGGGGGGGGGVGGNSQNDAAGKAFSELVFSSSPKPASCGTPRREVGGLRRAIPSARLNFKRRKIDHRDESPLGGGGRGSSKYSLVTSLLDSVASMQTSPTNKAKSPQSVSTDDRPMKPADSPSPPKRRRPSPRQESPTRTDASRQLAPQPQERAIPAAKQGIVPEAVGCRTTDESEKENAAEQDYGDDDFDDDMMMEIEARISSTQVISCDPTQAPAKDNPSPAPAPDPGLVANPISIDSSVNENQSLEYGDLVDDEFWQAAVVEIKGRTAPTAKPAELASHGVSAGGKPEGEESAVLGGDDLETEVVQGADESCFLEDGDDIDWDAIENGTASPAVATQVSNGRTSSVRNKNRNMIQRYLITAVLDGEYVDEYERQQPEKILVVEADSSRVTRTVHLRGEWYDTEAKTQSYVHIIGDFSPNGRCIVNDNENIVILHPDQLISATVAADSFGCMRRAVLQDRVKATSEPTAALIYGTLLHEIFQEALMAKRWDPLFLTGLIHRITDKHVEDLYTIKVAIPAAREHLESKMSQLRHWAITFVSAEPRPDAMVQDRNNKKVNMCINKLLDVEEHVWSPMYGLKGNIDATVQVQIRDGINTQTLTVPFEVKTGKHVSSHHTAQTALYNLLLSDRYDVDVTCGILYYMESSTTMRVPTIRRELRHMIMQRNQLAAYIRDRNVQLPPMARRANMCEKCYAKTPCFIYHALADDGDGETSGMGAKFEQAVAHLQPRHRDFFVRWENLLTLEEKESQKLKRELWTMVGADREKLGRCFADVVIDQVVEEANPTRINRYQYVFVKRKPAPPGFSFLESQLAMGEPVVVSDEKGHFALAIGYVTAVRKNRITLAVDRRLHNARVRQAGFDDVNNQVFGGIMEAKPRGAPAPATQLPPTESVEQSPQVTYRLDKDEFSNGMAVVRNNLVQIMADGVFGSQQIRRLVVDLESPRFKPVSTQYTISSSGHDSLNVDQKRAIEKVMSARDYALVLGMPGTGKTHTIAHMIRALVSQGKSVLLTSYTHTAVDNILLKLRDDKLGILRLGSSAKVHPEVQEFVTLAGQPMSSFDEIRQAWHGNPVVATTCLGISHPIFHERTFDVCIVDEASQITLPICLGPIRMAKTFVLVGDHNQLPPLVQSEAAREGGLDVSLFKRLSRAYPTSVVNLEHQYRMCEDIMTLSNTLIYQGRLRCGTESLRKRKLDVPNLDDSLRHRHHNADTVAASAFSGSGAPRSFCTGGDAASSCWLRQALDPERRVVFLDTDTLQPPAREEAKGNRIVNLAEAALAAQLVDALVLAGVPASEVGVMTHYRSQLSLLRRRVAGGSRHAAAVEMHTADRFQGRDKEVVVLSLVRANESGAIGDLLRDWRRVNVAFTRAKAKLLVVGSRSTLRGAESGMVGHFVRLMELKGWVLPLPGDALESHYFDDLATQQNPMTSPLATTRTPSIARVLSSARKRSPLKAIPGGGGGGGGVRPLKLPRANGGEKRPVGDMEDWAAGNKENNVVVGANGPVRKAAGLGEKAALKNRPITRDILNELTDGRFAYH